MSRVVRRLVLLAALALFVLLATGTTPARPTPDIWERTYGTDSSDELFWDGIETPDGYLLVGTATEPTRSDASDGYAVKLSDSGTVEWSRRFNVSDDDSLRAAARTADGGYVLSGDAVTFTETGGGPRWDPNVSGFVAKVSADGSVQWTRTPGTDAVIDVTPSGDGAVAAGSSLVRYRGDGSVAWNRTYDYDVHAVERTADALVVAGGGDGRVVHELAGDGSVSRTVYEDDARGSYSSLAVLDDGYLVGGQRYSDDASQYVDVTARLAQDGSVRWRHTESETNEGSSVVGVGAGAGELYGVVETNDGETLVRFGPDGAVLGQHALAFTEGVVAARSDHYLYASERADDAAVGIADVVTPTAALDAPERIDVGDRVRFDAGGSADNLGVATYEWDLDGDGRPDRRTEDGTVKHRFESLGSRTVAVTVRDVSGNSDRVTRRVAVVDDVAPTPALSVDPRPTVVGAETTFDATGSGDNHRVRAYRWDVGADGTVDATTRVGYFEHAHRTTGERTVAVTVVDESNNTATVTATVRVVENDRPTLSASAERVSGNRYRLRANVTDEIGETTVRWHLPGGLYVGETGVVRLPPGERELPVEVVDRFGARDYDTVTVTVPGTTTPTPTAEQVTTSTEGAAEDAPPSRSSTPRSPTAGSGVGFGPLVSLGGIVAALLARL